MNSTHSKTPKKKNITKPETLTIDEKKDRVRNGVRALKGALKSYEADHPRWKVEVLVSLIQWSLKSLKHYIEDVRDKEITWEQPFAELRYPVEWDWTESKSRGEDCGRLLYGDVTDRSLSDRDTAVKTLAEIMVRVMNATAISELTNGVRFARNGNKQTLYLPIECAHRLNSIRDKDKRIEAQEQITRPFSIGAAMVDYGTMDLNAGTRVSAKVAEKLGKLSESIDIPQIGFQGDVNGRKIEISLVFQIHPLITDHDEEKAFHPIIVGLFIVPEVSNTRVLFENPAKWSREDRENFWKELFQALETLVDKLIPKAESEDSVILTFNARIKVPASRWRPENRGDEVKIITDALSFAGELSQIDVRTEDAQDVIQRTKCPVCDLIHDLEFNQFLFPGSESITLKGALSDIVRCVHAAHEKGLPHLSTKDDDLLRRCGGYGSPSKAFYDLRKNAAYKVLFDTSRRGFVALHGFARTQS